MITLIYQDKYDNQMCVTPLYSTTELSIESNFFCDETDTREYLALRYIMCESSHRKERVMRNSERGLR